MFLSDDTCLPSEDIEYKLRLSTAALLIEVSRADFEQDTSELEQMRMLLAREFSLLESEVDELMQDAHEHADNLVSLQHITRLLNEQFDQAAKYRVIHMLWKVVYADGVKDRYEEALIRQVAELLYVPHAVFIQARHEAERLLT